MTSKVLNISKNRQRPMRWLIYFFMTMLLISCVSAGEHITLLYPEDLVTYGPWSDTYFFYERTQSEAHHIRIQVENSNEVAYYNIIRNDEAITYAGDQTQTDFNPDDAIVDFEPDDLEPLDLVGYLSTMNDIEVIAYNNNGEEIDRDSVTFYLAVNIGDYFDILETQPEFNSVFEITDEDLSEVEINREVYEQTSELFTITKNIIYATVKNKFTDETEEHTRVEITITPNVPGENLILYSLIPKQVVDNVNGLTLEQEFVVEDPDPLLMWSFAQVQEPKTLTYHVNKHLSEDEAEEIKLIAVSDAEVEAKPLIYYLFPILLIPILIGTLVYFSRYQKEVK